jgi:hypothetical protein
LNMRGMSVACLALSTTVIEADNSHCRALQPCTWAMSSKICCRHRTGPSGITSETTAMSQVSPTTRYASTRLAVMAHAHATHTHTHNARRNKLTPHPGPV